MDAGRSPVVYIANFAGHDYSKLREWGALRHVTNGTVSFQSLDRVRYLIAEGLREVQAEDYLALSGANIINVVAAVLWYHKFGVVRILNYDKKTDSYRELEMTNGNCDMILEALR